MSLGIRIAERGWLPDSVVRAGIRRLLRGRIRSIERDTEEERHQLLVELVDQMDTSPVALATDLPNRQHYEVPAGFFERALGRRLKYSCCFWPRGTADLDAAEVAMLERTCQNAGLADGMRVLELGCGWGSLSLWMAEHYPDSRIVAVSNSATQKDYIDRQARERAIENLTVITADMNDFSPAELSAATRFDRVVSVEMFEHMRNYRELLRRIRSWLQTDGRLFVHVFCHRRWPYTFETEDDDDWMATHFFTAGLMPSDDLLYQFKGDLEVERQWTFSGEHYERTSEAWLRNLDANRDEVVGLFKSTYGESAAELWFHRWRIFFLACAELFGMHRGQEWWVSHYLLRPTDV
jgi:cyclopropane-fatty-acyl-phospholipid synthase